MNFKTGYKYDHITKQFLNQVDCQQSPLEPGVWLTPPDVTFVTLISEHKNTARIFNEQTQLWQYAIDNRNKTMYLKQKSLITKKTSNNLFDPIPDEYTLVVPPDKQKYYKFVNNKWKYYFQPVTRQSLYELTYQKKIQYCYGGITLVKDGIKYKFETTQDSINFGNSTIIRLQFQDDDAIVKWKMWSQNNQPVNIEFTKIQFQNLYKFSLIMVNSTFEIQGFLNNKIAIMKDEQLASESKINSFKKEIQTQFSYLVRTVNFEDL